MYIAIYKNAIGVKNPIKITSVVSPNITLPPRASACVFLDGLHNF